MAYSMGDAMAIIPWLHVVDLFCPLRFNYHMDFPRDKSDHLQWKIAYTFLRIVRLFFGRSKTLIFLLDCHWMLRRLAFEEVGKEFGSIFHNNYLGLTEQWFLENIDSRDSVLDIGCGTGRWSNLASRKSSNVLGIDISEKSLNIARKVGTSANFEIFNATSSLKELGHFHVGILVHLLEHIQEPHNLLVELLEVCDRLIIEVPDLEADPLNGIRILTGRRYYSDSDHVREYSEGLLVSQLNDAGWEPISIKKSGAAIAVIAVPYLNRTNM